MPHRPRPEARAVPSPGPTLLTVLCVPMFLVLLDVLAMNVAMPTLGGGFGVPPDRWSDVVDTYTVPLAVGLLPCGWLVDRVGPRRVLLTGLVLFAIASAVGAAAPSWAVVLGARTGQGVAAAAMLPAGLAALSLAWPQPGPRARALGIWSGVSAAATALGPGLGGVVVQALGWRALFLVDVPLVLLAAIGTARLLPDQRVSRGGAEVGRADRRPFLASLVAAAMMTSGANGTLQVITVHLQGEAGWGAGSAGALLLVATLPFALLGPVSGPLVARHGRRRIASAGFAAGGLGLSMLGCGAVGLVVALLGIGVGLGLMTAAVVGESLTAWPSRPGLAGGLNNAWRQVGTSAGVALGGVAVGHGSGEALLRGTGLVAGGWWLAAALVVAGGFGSPGRGGGGG